MRLAKPDYSHYIGFFSGVGAFYMGVVWDSLFGFLYALSMAAALSAHLCYKSVLATREQEALKEENKKLSAKFYVLSEEMVNDSMRDSDEFASFEHDIRMAKACWYCSSFCSPGEIKLPPRMPDKYARNIDEALCNKQVFVDSNSSFWDSYSFIQSELKPEYEWCDIKPSSASDREIFEKIGGHILYDDHTYTVVHLFVNLEIQKMRLEEEEIQKAIKYGNSLQVFTHLPVAQKEIN